MSITRRNSSGVSRVAGTAVPTPALLTSTSTRPSSRHGLLDHARAVLGQRDVGGDGQAAAAERLDALGGLLQAVGAAGADGDVGARLGEADGERGAEAGGGAGDDGDLAVEPEAVEDGHGAARYHRRRHEAPARSWSSHEAAPRRRE